MNQDAARALSRRVDDFVTVVAAELQARQEDDRIPEWQTSLYDFQRYGGKSGHRAGHDRYRVVSSATCRTSWKIGREGVISRSWCTKIWTLTN